MVKYTLVYFNGRGRAEVPRLLFAQAGVEYEDRRIQREEWASLKPATPTGQLPYMDIDGVHIGQSMAIARYIAREFSLYGANNLEATQIDMLCDCVGEILELFVRVKYGEGDAKAKARQTLVEKLPKVLQLLSDTLVKNGSGWFVGDKVSLADFVAYQYINTVVNYGEAAEELSAEWKKFDEISKHDEKVTSLPKIAEWIAKRPVTEF